MSTVPCAVAFARIRMSRMYWVLRSSMALKTSKLGAKKATFSQFVSALPTKYCRYCIFEHSFTTKDGRPTSKAYFIIWNPRRASAHLKVLYTTHKKDVEKAIGGLGMIVADGEDELRREMNIPEEPSSDDSSSDDDDE